MHVTVTLLPESLHLSSQSHCHMTKNMYIISLMFASCERHPKGSQGTAVCCFVCIFFFFFVCVHVCHTCSCFALQNGVKHWWTSLAQIELLVLVALRKVLNSFAVSRNRRRGQFSTVTDRFSRHSNLELSCSFYCATAYIIEQINDNERSFGCWRCSAQYLRHAQCFKYVSAHL